VFCVMFHQFINFNLELSMA